MLCDAMSYETATRLVESTRTCLEPDEQSEAIAGAMEGMTYDQKFCYLLRAGLDQPLIILTIALLPNVQEIQVRDRPHPSIALPWKMPSHRFQKLRGLVVDGGSLCWPMSFFDPTLTECELESFETHRASSWNWDVPLQLISASLISQPTLNFAPQSLSLKRLALDRSSMSEIDLEYLVKACPNLTSFHYRGNYNLEGPIITPATVVELLEPLKSTLQEMTLVLEVGFEWINNDRRRNLENRDREDEDDEEERPELIISLAHFGSMKVLTTNANIWSGARWEIEHDEKQICLFPLAHRLPPNLETLEFVTLDTRWGLPVSQVAHLLQAQPAHLPKLRDLRIFEEEIENQDELKATYKRVLESREANSQEANGREAIVGQETLEFHVGFFFPEKIFFFSRIWSMTVVQWDGEKYTLSLMDAFDIDSEDERDSESENGDDSWDDGLEFDNESGSEGESMIDADGISG